MAPADRRAERRDLLLDAAFGLLGTEGWAGTTVRAVCHEARLNPRYFYESFEDLDTLVVAVYDRLVEQLQEDVREAVDRAPDTVVDRVRAAVATTVRFVDEDRRRARILYVEALGNETLNRRRIETGHAVAAFVQTDAAERHGPPAPGEEIGAETAAVLVGGFSDLLVAWLDGRIDVTRDQLIDDAAELFLALGAAAGRIATRRAGAPTRVTVGRGGGG